MREKGFSLRGTSKEGFEEERKFKCRLTFNRQAEVGNRSMCKTQPNTQWHDVKRRDLKSSGNISGSACRCI